jgi:MoaA/NifB/PqqE/SkfB family radical SAM enzyme
MTTALHQVATIENGGRLRDYGPPRLIVELTNICNLHCSYCLRDEDALYHAPANFFSVELLRRVVAEARDTIGASHVMFTGGETTLHPNLKEVIETVAKEGLRCSFVTNGWHFERVWQAIRSSREALTHVAFSLDGATREAHDRWRGQGSLVRLARAFSICRRAELPFVVKTVIRKDTLSSLEQIALFAARMGASATSFSHLLPTSSESEEQSGLSAEERTAAEQEVAMLARMLKMKVSLDVGYYNIDPAAPCSALATRSCNIDYRGRLSLCCNLSGYRGATDETDVLADLNHESFAAAFARLQDLANLQISRRREALTRFAAEKTQPDLSLGSPCLFCLKTFRKASWHSPEKSARALPIMQTVVA